MDVMVENEEVKIERMVLGSWSTNAYIIQCVKTGKCVVVDMPPGAPAILDELKGSIPEYILLTHNHIDHIAGLLGFRNKLKAALAVHPLDAGGLPKPERLLEDGEEVAVGNLKIEVLHTPGHTPGSLCFRVGEYLIAGDTLFPGGPGRTDSPPDFERILLSIGSRILPLAVETQVYPGHGGPTSVGEARGEYAAFTSRAHPQDLCGDVEWRTS